MSLIRVAVLVVAAGVCGTTLVACCCGTPSSTGSGASAAVLPTKFAQELRPTQANQAQLAPVAAQR